MSTFNNKIRAGILTCMLILCCLFMISVIYDIIEVNRIVSLFAYSITLLCVTAILYLVEVIRDTRIYTKIK